MKCLMTNPVIYVNQNYVYEQGCKFNAFVHVLFCYVVFEKEFDQNLF